MADAADGDEAADLAPPSLGLAPDVSAFLDEMDSGRDHEAAMDAEEQWSMYQKLGFGMVTGSGIPGESSGTLSLNAMNNDFERATMAFGYGISVTPLQLAHATVCDEAPCLPGRASQTGNPSSPPGMGVPLHP